VVCKADASGAWVSQDNAEVGGTYHAAQICQQLGYQGLGQFGDTLQSVCGVDTGNASCSNPDDETFDGSDACGSDAFGQILCGTVHWLCVGPFRGQAVSAPALSPTVLAMLAGLLAVLGIRGPWRRHT